MINQQPLVAEGEGQQKGPSISVFVKKYVKAAAQRAEGGYDKGAILSFFRSDDHKIKVKQRDASSSGVRIVDVLPENSIEHMGDAAFGILRKEGEPLISPDMGFVLNFVAGKDKGADDETEELTTNFASLSLGGPMKPRAHVVTDADADATSHFVVKDGRLDIPVFSLPENIEFPQKVKKIEMLQSSGKRRGSVNVISYMGMPVLGRIIGPFEIDKTPMQEEQNEEMDRGSEENSNRYVVQVTASENREEMSFILWQHNQQTVEESVWLSGRDGNEKDKKKGAVVFSGRGQDCLVIDESGEALFDGNLAGAEQFPDFKSHEELMAYVDKNLNIPSMLKLMALSQRKDGVDEDVFSAHASACFKTQPEKTNGSWFFGTDQQSMVGKDIKLDETVQNVSKVRFSDGWQEITTGKMHNIQEEAAGAVYGPIILNTPDEKRVKYCIHLVARSDGRGYTATGVPCDELSEAWEIVKIKSATGQYTGRKGLVVINVSAGQNGDVTSSVLRDGKPIVNAVENGFWKHGYTIDVNAQILKQNVYIPDFGGILNLVASIGNKVTNTPSCTPHVLLTEASTKTDSGVFTSKSARNTAKIPHYRELYPYRRFVYGTKLPVKVVGAAVNTVRKHPRKAIAAGAAVGAFSYAYYSDPSSFDAAWEQLPSLPWDSINGFVASYGQQALNYIGFGAGPVTCEPCERVQCPQYTEKMAAGMHEPTK
ncbi:hypothetical protein M3P05_14625 [Sansalvadorimonas sp. 2012CJ34-2]|uniref:Uncharacterized protein n=1 Tax=Parendozoicomonas callyspongiae TaxID=2942213 RepID=A0ABT0PIG2_9GAMM|nr:hypothetical protein [Sansalvadorimonas sp. 2012CJ34-2]MCL6271158.1 hypothetical protein [Sansalvadorimonas sp. 2012CJ34-2]